MDSVQVSKADGIATVTMARGKVNAINEPVVEELKHSFEDLAKDTAVKAVILTGRGKFFSFGFDIPEFLSYPKDDFARYLIKFADLYRSLFLFPKPVVAAINGHAIAGGCMLATACDYRVMVPEKAKIALNEITFGASVFAGIVEILKYCVGSKNAATILYSGNLYSPQEALELGLIDQIASPENLLEAAVKTAEDFAQKNPVAFKRVKDLLKQPVADEISKRETSSIHEFVDIWYSAETWANLQEIKIYS